MSGAGQPYGLGILSTSDFRTPTSAFRPRSEVSTNLYTWGLDLSGSLQGAGGIGGLVSRTEVRGSTTKTVYYHYDANGNVTDLTDAGGNTVAHYEYSPYGEVVSSTGAEAQNNKFRFSSKYFDDETGLGYWGYRYYHPETGRWLSRDPLEEGGGVNLYGMCGNDLIEHMILMDCLDHGGHLMSTAL